MTDLPSFITQELAVLKERILLATDETLQDPVFEGMVREMIIFHECLGGIRVRAMRLVRQIEALGESVDDLSQVVLSEYQRTISGDEQIISDCLRFREASNRISRTDAPHSCVAKFKRDLEYNVLSPLKAHVDRCQQLGGLIDLRNRRLAELTAAERTGSPEVDKLKSEFESTDRELFEWLSIIREFKGDILDSLLQTLKYLEYEFFASSAHAIASCLPERMEFRPMVEMVPSQLAVEIKKDRMAGKSVDGDFSKKIANTTASSDQPAVEVDVLSLSSLLAQGFEEGPARRALRKCNNDTQGALELLLNPAGGSQVDSVRMPSTLSRIARSRRPLDTPDLISFTES